MRWVVESDQLFDNLALRMLSQNKFALLKFRPHQVVGCQRTNRLAFSWNPRYAAAIDVGTCFLRLWPISTLSSNVRLFYPTVLLSEIASHLC
jgi:hypothetical protein